MTGLSRPVTRETREIDARTRRPLVIRLEEGGKLVKIRPKGTRNWYVVTVKQILIMGAKNLIQERKRLRAEAKAARKKER